MDPNGPMREKRNSPSTTWWRKDSCSEERDEVAGNHIILTIGLPNLLGFMVAPVDRCFCFYFCLGVDGISESDLSRGTQIVSESPVTKSLFFFLTSVFFAF